MLAADGGEPEKVTDLPLGAGAPVWSPDGERSRSRAPVDPRDPTATAARCVTDGPSTTRPTAPACSARSATSCTWSTSPPATAASSPTATTPASRPGRPTAAPSRSPARSAPTATSPSAPPCTCSTSTTPRREPRVVAFEDGIAGTVSFSADGESLLVVGHPGLALGHAHLLRVPLDGGAPVDLTGHLDRNVMPGGPAYPGALPRRDRRRPAAVRDPRPRLLAPVGRGRSGPRRRRPRRLRALGRRRHRRGRARHARRRTARSSRSTSRPAPRPC